MGIPRITELLEALNPNITAMLTLLNAADLTFGENEQLVVSNVSIGFTASKLLPVAGTFAGKQCQKILLQALNYDVYIALDGSVVTSSNGVKLIAGDWYVVNSYLDAQKIRFIRSTSDASVRAFMMFEV